MEQFFFISMGVNVALFLALFYNIGKKHKYRSDINTLQNRIDYLRAQNARLEELDASYKHILQYFND